MEEVAGSIPAQPTNTQRKGDMQIAIGQIWDSKVFGNCLLEVLDIKGNECYTRIEHAQAFSESVWVFESYILNNYKLREKP